MKTLDFVLPEGLDATEPPPVRDGVRLLVASAAGVRHARFARIGEFLAPGDLVVVNTSATLASALDGDRAGVPVEVHFSSQLDDGDWVVEIRPAGAATGPVDDLRPGEVVTLDDGATLVVGRPRPPGQARLWQAQFREAQFRGPRARGDERALAFLARHGRPIRYAYVPRPWPLSEYQTVFAREPGSAEMPSAGRPFSERVVTDLITRGVAVAPVVLHTGVSSQEPGEPPQPERFRVPEATARLVNATRQAGGRVIAVGTTVTRALESAADPDGPDNPDGLVHPRHGTTDLVLSPSRPARVVTGLVTGWHAPGASHLALLAAVAGEPLVERAYAEAVRLGYRWHEFGDSCLLLPLGTRWTAMSAAVGRRHALQALTRTMPAPSTGLSTALRASSAETFDTLSVQRSSACSTMIMVPPGPAKTDQLIPGAFACARVHRDMSCFVMICDIPVISVITLSLLSAEPG